MISWRFALAVTALALAATSASAQENGNCKPGVTRTGVPHLALARSLVYAGNDKDIDTLRSLLTPDAVAFDASEKAAITAEALISATKAGGESEKYVVQSSLISNDNVTLQLQSPDGDQVLLTLSIDKGCITAIAYFD